MCDVKSQFTHGMAGLYHVKSMLFYFVSQNCLAEIALSERIVNSYVHCKQTEKFPGTPENSSVFSGLCPYFIPLVPDLKRIAAFFLF